MEMTQTITEMLKKPKPLVVKDYRCLLVGFLREIADGIVTLRAQPTLKE